MADERYKAPGASVGEREAAHDGAPRPYEVGRALQLLWAVFFIGLVTLHPGVRGEWWLGAEPIEAELHDAAFVGGVILATLFSAVYVALVFFLGRRRAWARWAMLAFLVLGWVLTGIDLPRSLAETPAAAFADVLMAAVEVWACWLLFSAPASAWFRR